jgi:hypothetical protein
MWSLLILGCLLVLSVFGDRSIDRRKVVRSFNPRRNASSGTTPLQVGNGNFAFGADITGLQTFNPFAILSTWGWHNFSLPTTEGQTSIDGKIKPPFFMNQQASLLYSRLHWFGLVDSRPPSQL